MTLVLTLLMTLAIGLTTLMPSSSGPAPLLGLDKVAHLLAFGLLVIPITVRYPKHWPVIWMAALTYGGLIEIVQPYVGRGAEWADLVANGVGAAFAIALVHLYQRLRPRRENGTHGR